MSSAPSRFESRGFPLGALFVFTAFSCILAAHLLPVVRAMQERKITLEAVLGSAIASGVVCAVVGTIFGTMQRRPIIGGLLGSGTGLTIGLILGPVLCLPSDRFGQLMSTSLIGSVLLLVVAVITRSR